MHRQSRACKNSVTTGATVKVGSQGASMPKVAAATYTEGSKAVDTGKA